MLRQEDTEDSDLDLLIDADDGFSLFDMAAIAIEIESLGHTRVDVKTPDDLSAKICDQIIAEAQPL